VLVPLADALQLLSTLAPAYVLAWLNVCHLKRHKIETETEIEVCEKANETGRPNSEKKN